MNELVSRVISGDKQAFEAIYQATYRQVYYTCMSFLKNEQNAQDIMQDTYITALTHTYAAACQSGQDSRLVKPHSGQ